MIQNAPDGLFLFFVFEGPQFLGNVHVLVHDRVVQDPLNQLEILFVVVRHVLQQNVRVVEFLVVFFVFVFVVFFVLFHVLFVFRDPQSEALFFSLEFFNVAVLAFKNRFWSPGGLQSPEFLAPACTFLATKSRMSAFSFLSL